jgi:propionyl-CoA carboxylase alpha chain
VQHGIPVAWRNVVSQPQRTTFDDGSAEPVEVSWWGGRDGYVLDGATVRSASPERVVLEVDGVATAYRTVVTGLPGHEVVEVDAPTGHRRLVRVPRFTDPSAQLAAGSLLAPMPGTVVSVAVEAGARVEAGQTVLVLEAMKMQHTVAAPTAGTVTDLPVRAGQQVAAGEVLAVVDDEEQEQA